MDNVCEGDMVLINNDKVVNVGYVSGRVNVPFLGVCYNVIEINENGESRHLMAKEKFWNVNVYIRTSCRKVCYLR